VERSVPQGGVHGHPGRPEARAERAPVQEAAVRRARHPRGARLYGVLRRWAAKEAEGNTQLLEGLAIVDACLRIVAVHKPQWWVMENPVGRLKDWIGHHNHTFNPNKYAGYLSDEPTGRRIRLDFASARKAGLCGVEKHDGTIELDELEWMEEAYTKRTCLWGNFNEPEEKEKPNLLGSKMWACYGGKSERTKELRSMTPRGFSEAFFRSNP
jgi:hypothetical protein